MILLQQNKKGEIQGIMSRLNYRRELKKVGRGMKDRVDRSIGIVTRIVETLVKSRLQNSS